MSIYKHKCPACGSPCREILATSVAGCTNPRCRFFETEAREVLDLVAKAEEELRTVFPGLSP